MRSLTHTQRVLLGLFLFGAACLLPQLAMAASAADPTSLNGFLNPISDFLNTADNVARSLGNTFAKTDGPGMAILAACVAIRILMIVIPVMADKNGGDLGPEIVKLIVTVVILLSLMANWTQGLDLYSKVWGSLDGLVTTVAQSATTIAGGTAPSIPENANPLPGLAAWLFHSAVQDIINVYTDIGNIAGLFASKGAVHMVTHPFESLAGVGTFIVGALLALVGVGVIALVFLMMFFELFLSWAHIIVPLAFGPLLLAFYPIKPDWSLNIVKEVASGTIAFMATVFLVAVANTYIGHATVVLNQQAALTSTGAVSFDVSAITTVAVFIFVVYLIGYGASAVSKVAVSLVSGNDHFNRHRGTGGAMAGSFAGGMIGGYRGAAARAAGKIAQGVAGGAAAASKVAGKINPAMAAKVRGAQAVRAAANAARVAGRNADALRNAGKGVGPVAPTAGSGLSLDPKD